MLGFSILNTTQSNLAFAPFCLDNNNSHVYNKQTHTYTDQLLDENLYFNGYNDGGNILHNVGSSEEVGKGNKTLDDFDEFASNNWSLEDFLLGGNTEQVACVPDATVSFGSSAAASPASHATLSSSGSLDNLLDDLEITSPYGSPTSSGIHYGSPTSSGIPYGSPTSSGIPYGSPTSSGIPYGSPTSSGIPYGSPTSSGIPYGSPTSSGIAFGSAASITSPYGSPPSITSPYGSPSSMTSPYGSPPSITSPYGSPSSRTSYYGASTSSGSSALSSPRGSPTSSLNSCPLDDLMYDFTTPFTSPVSASPPQDLEFVDDIEQVQNNDMDIQATISTEEIVEMSSGFAARSTEAITNTQATVVEAATPNIQNEINFVEMLSPNSIDSGIASDEELIVNNLKNGQLCDNPGLLELLAYFSPVEKVSDFTVIGQTASNRTESPSPSVKSTQRFAPYKGKGKRKTEEQKLRKKEHNRKSASKYRSKKKQECDDKSGVLDQLEERNTKLKTNVEDLRKEIDYLKSLLLDVIKTSVSKKTNASLETLLAAGLTN